MRSHGIDEPRKQYAPWKQIEEWVTEIVDHLIIASVKPDAVIAVGRGGLIPASMILYHYGRRLEITPSLDVMYAQSYGDIGQQGDLVVGHIPAGRSLALRQHHEILIVDDIADSGATLSYLLKEFKKAQTATLVHKKRSCIVPDFYGLSTDTEEWIVFPWEINQ